MLGVPAPTPFDLRFRLLNIPVRVSAWFWIGAAMLGGLGGSGIMPLVTWLGCVFASILLHEYGHGLTARAFGYRAEIVLHAMGGLCFNEGERQTPNERLAVLLMGPGSQLLLLGAMMLWARLTWGLSWSADLAFAKLVLGILPMTLESLNDPGLREYLMAQGRMGRMGPIYFDLFQINLLWPLLNLLPILPLDGGQIAHVLLTRADRVHGPRRAHIVSLVTAGGMAAYCASRMNTSGGLMAFYPVLFFGAFALMNYQALQAHHRHYVEHGPDDADWWKK